jgi:8-oxo-dGTP diphosphatase
VTAKREWVVGFLLDERADRVVLIRKNRPAWQAGKLNGVGGKVEPGDRTLNDAMEREFREEACVTVYPWERYACLNWEEGVVHFYRAFVPDRLFDACQTVTDEPVEIHRVHELFAPGPLRDGVTPNLLWLVPLAAHRHDTYDVIDVVETGTTMRKPGRDRVIAAASCASEWPVAFEVIAIVLVVGFVVWCVTRR